MSPKTLTGILGIAILILAFGQILTSRRLDVLERQMRAISVDVTIHGS